MGFETSAWCEDCGAQRKSVKEIEWARLPECWTSGEELKERGIPATCAGRRRNHALDVAVKFEAEPPHEKRMGCCISRTHSTHPSSSTLLRECGKHSSWSTTPAGIEITIGSGLDKKRRSGGREVWAQSQPCSVAKRGLVPEKQPKMAASWVHPVIDAEGVTKGEFGKYATGRQSWRNSGCSIQLVRLERGGRASEYVR